MPGAGYDAGMPEGDTIHRSARTLGRALTGASVTGVTAQAPRLQPAGAQRLVGERVAQVEARGKHLLVWFAPSDLALHTHLGMSGSWHLYRPGQRWQKPARRASVVLDTPDWTAVCFSATVCELRGRAQTEVDASLAGLGPDAAAPGTDLDEARRRLDTRPEWAIGEALLDQRVLCGVGNVYKNEVLFLHGVDPWAPVRVVPAAARGALLASAEQLLKANLRSALRTTTGPPGAVARGGRLFVYGRAGKPCRRCGTPVRVDRQGAQARLTYWCPHCQQPAEAH